MTRLLDKGIKLPNRAMPVSGDLRLEVDQDARRALVLYGLEKSAIPVIAKLLHPQLSDVSGRAFVAHGYEVGSSGQLFGQAWELEPIRR